MLSVLIFAAFPPCASPPCFNMNEQLPRLGLKHIVPVHSREEKFRLNFRIAQLHVHILLHPTSAGDCQCVRLKGGTYQAALTSQVPWGEVLVTACALLKWFPDLAVQRESLLSASTLL